MSGAKKIVAKLKCKVCVKFESKIAGRRNYSNKWIVGADSVRTSNIKEHARTDQHAHVRTINGQSKLSFDRAKVDMTDTMTNQYSNVIFGSVIFSRKRG